MTNNTTPATAVAIPKSVDTTSELLPVGGRVGLGVVLTIPVGWSVGIAVGARVIVGVALGILVGASVAEGVADWVTCEPLAYTTKDCWIVLRIPDASFVVIDKICCPGDNGVVGRYVQLPLLSLVTVAVMTASEWIS